MQAVLVMFRSDGDRRSFSVARDITVIGRREDCDLRIPLGDVSRKHCRLVRDGETLRLEDLGSSNGTYHNGQRVQEVELSPGDSVQVGPVVFVLQVDGVPADDELSPIMAAAPEEQSAAAAAEGAEGDAPTIDQAPEHASHAEAGDLAEAEAGMPSSSELLEPLVPLDDEDDDGFDVVLEEAERAGRAAKSRQH